MANKDYLVRFVMQIEVSVFFSDKSHVLFLVRGRDGGTFS